MQEVDRPRPCSAARLKWTKLQALVASRADGVRCQKKQIVIGIRQRNGDLRLIRANNTKAKTVREIVNANIGGHVEVVLTDESMIYPYVLKQFPIEKHHTINHSKEYAHGDVHTNTVESAFSLLKRGIVGTWHKVSAKHLPAYLDEMCFRFNNRKNPYLFRDTLTKMIQTSNLEYKEPHSNRSGTSGLMN